MSNKRYIHYGSRCFEREFFDPIYCDRVVHTKPRGGLWASPVDAKWGWKEWCRESNFRECSTGKSFCFHLAPSAKVLYIDNVECLAQLPQRQSELVIDTWCCLDFEKLLADGWDAVEVCISDCQELYWRLYGWDCDSIVVMNPDVIVEE